MNTIAPLLAIAENARAEARRTSRIVPVKASANQKAATGKWSICFNMHRISLTDNYIAASCESAAVFDTAVEAHAGGLRAIEFYNSNDGMFPNMCEKF